MISDILAVALLVSSAPDGSTEIQRIAALIAPIREAYFRVESRQASEPPATSDSERLLRLGELDQAGRDALSKVDLAKLSPDQKKASWRSIWAEITPHDEADQIELKKLLPPDGWFTISKYGLPATKAAFLVVQHSGDESFQKMILTQMTKLVGTNELDGQSYGLLWDRLALRDGKLQRYGSQVHCIDGAYVPYDLEDPTHVDERRAKVGFKETEVEYLKRFAGDPCR